MKQPLSRPFSIVLDLLRGLAALVVLLGHAVRLGLYTGPWPFDRTFAHGAVILFFVLSGYVVHRSTVGAARTLRDLRSPARRASCR